MMVFDTYSSDVRKVRIFSGLLVLVIVVGVIGFSGVASAQSNRDLNSRINRLDNEVKTLSRAIFRGEEPPVGALSGGGDPAVQANTEIRLQQMAAELQTMRGLVEEQGFEVRQLKAELERVRGDMELRLQDLENGGVGSAGSGGRGLGITTQGNNPPQPGGSGYNWNSNSGGAVPSQPAPQTPSAPAQNQLGTYTQSPAGGVINGGEDLAAATYENAFSMVKNNQYDAAEKEFQIFLDQYPNHVLVGNAKYWLGETYYVRGQFENAARLFAEGYQQFPKGNKAADNLLKLGMSLSAMGKADDACIALSQIDKAGFANAGPVMRRVGQEKTRLGCAS